MSCGGFVQKFLGMDFAISGITATIVLKFGKEGGAAMSKPIEILNEAIDRISSCPLCNSEDLITNGFCARCCKASRRKAHRHNRRIRYSRRTARGRLKTLDWATVLLVYKNKCAICETDNKALTLDHIVSLSKGGRNVFNNIRPLCIECHREKDGAKMRSYARSPRCLDRMAPCAPNINPGDLIEELYARRTLRRRLWDNVLEWWVGACLRV
jgi:hypothetical protein